MCQQSSKRMFMTEFLLESPQDPATYQEGQESPSFFEWPQLQQLFEEDENMKMVCFDQRATGHCRRKPTGLLTNLPMMERLEHCKEVQLIQLVESFVREWQHRGAGPNGRRALFVPSVFFEGDAQGGRRPVQVAKLDLDRCSMCRLVATAVLESKRWAHDIPSKIQNSFCGPHPGH